MKENRHTILISCSRADAVPEIIRWGEADWWPKNSLMRFTRSDKGPVVVGTRYRQEVLMPFAPSWDAQVQDLSDSGITRRFMNGMFEGSETVSCGENASGVEVVYLMRYRVRGILNWLLWNPVFRRMHDANIEAILANLKEYLERKKS